MEIQIPSPSVFLRKSPVLNAAPVVLPKKTAIAKSKTNAATKPANKAVQDGAVTKPKQSKSRNGCTTCKKKRLKCDETKPSCQQCQKRSVVCEGYKRDFKWKTFEELNTTKPATKRRAVRSNSFSSSQNVTQPLNIAGGGRSNLGHVGVDNSQPPQTWSPGLHSAFTTGSHLFSDKQRSHDPSLDSNPERRGDVEYENGPSPPLNLTPDSIFMPTFESGSISPSVPFDATVDPYGLTSATTRSSVDEANDVKSFTSSSPKLLDLLLSESDMEQPLDPGDLHPPMVLDAELPMEDDFDGEILRSDAMATSGTTDFPSPSPLMEPAFSNTNFQSFRMSSPAPSETSSTSSKSSDMTLLAQPSLEASSPEMLMLRFDRQTCGILSVKDGPTENPWRTLVWPLAQESPALYHAISSMTAFHGTHEMPNLHVPGMAHMTKAIKKLASEMGNMRLDSALATSLALAFGEGWDRHVSTGVQHLRGARFMVNNAVVKHRRDMQLGHMTNQDASRLKFLCNTFVYMDVIACLTSIEEAPELNLEEVLTTFNASYGDQLEVDPLMGCATTLFPIIGRVAKLIQRVRRTASNSLTVISTAMELKEQLQQWRVPNAVVFERPEDPNSEVQHSIQTAEAYRYATLLYLHQAVPEIPSDPAFSLAKKVLVTLASVPLSSRTTIVQIFPLFAASCEVTDPEDRDWVIQRWAAMIVRLKIGNVNSCWSVIQEVWHRRDSFESEKSNRLMRQYANRGAPGGNFVPPVLDIPPASRRKVQTVDATGSGVIDSLSRIHDQSQAKQAGLPEEVDSNGKQIKRRVTTGGLGGGSGIVNKSINMPVSLPRRHTGDIISPDQLEPEYTVRGHLHWLGVMADRNWEVFLG